MKKNAWVLLGLMFSFSAFAEFRDVPGAREERGAGISTVSCDGAKKDALYVPSCNVDEKIEGVRVDSGTCNEEKGDVRRDIPNRYSIGVSWFCVR